MFSCNSILYWDKATSSSALNSNSNKSPLLNRIILSSNSPQISAVWGVGIAKPVIRGLAFGSDELVGVLNILPIAIPTKNSWKVSIQTVLKSNN